MSFPIEKLSDYAKISWGNTSITKKSYVDKGYPAFSATGQDGFLPDFEFDEDGIVLSAIGARCGKCFLAKGKWTAIKNTITITTKDKEKLNLNYLFYIVNNEKFWSQRGGGQPFIALGDARKIKIPFPVIDDQKRIAHLLGKVEGLIAQRKQHLQQLDDLLKSVFLEMFGDPVRNEKGWDVRPCDKVVTDIKSGTSYGGEDKDFLDNDEYGVLKISAVTQGYFNPREFKAVRKSVISKPLRFIQKGDLLFSRANTIELVAACCIVPENSDKLFLPDKLWVLSLDESVNIQFFNYLLKNENFRNLVRKQASGGHDSMLNISMKKFRSLNVPVPDEGLQNQFAAIIEKVEGLKSHYQQSLADLEQLYGTLSQKAFKGELDLSRVIVTMDKEEPAEVMEPITTKLPDTQPVIELPAPDSVAGFFSAEGRKALLGQWLEVYLDQLGSMPFSAQHFMETAQQRMVELLEELQEPESLTTDYEFFRFGPHEYDHVKELIFQALESGHLAQTYDEAGNRVQLTMAKG